MVLGFFIKPHPQPALDLLGSGEEDTSQGVLKKSIEGYESSRNR